MEKDPKKEIMVDAKWSILEDGWGYQVLSLGGMPGVHADGRRIVTFTIKPDELVRKRYEIAGDIELDSNGNMTLIILEEDLIPLNIYDDANRKWLYVKSLRHQPTYLSEREINLKTQLNAKDKRILLLEADNIRLNEQLELAKTNPAKFIKQGAEVFESTARAWADMTKEKKNE